MRVFCVVAALLVGCPVMAGPAQDKVLACFSEIGETTDWNTCLTTMFAPCEGLEVGSDAHLGCLEQEREDWQAAKFVAETDVVDVLSHGGMEELGGVMLAWPKFVEDKCKSVAEARAEISYAAAGLGCQISELALITSELRACLTGRSEEAYCQLKSE